MVYSLIWIAIFVAAGLYISPHMQRLEDGVHKLSDLEKRLDRIEQKMDGVRANQSSLPNK